MTLLYSFTVSLSFFPFYFWKKKWFYLESLGFLGLLFTIRPIDTGLKHISFRWFFGPISFLIIQFSLKLAYYLHLIQGWWFFTSCLENKLLTWGQLGGFVVVWKLLSHPRGFSTQQPACPEFTGLSMACTLLESTLTLGASSVDVDISSRFLLTTGKFFDLHNGKLILTSVSGWFDWLSIRPFLRFRHLASLSADWK